ncbi:hypothetical protein ACJX0J_018917, partial [Zea mays]
QPNDFVLTHESWGIFTHLIACVYTHYNGDIHSNVNDTHYVSLCLAYWRDLEAWEIYMRETDAHAGAVALLFPSWLNMMTVGFDPIVLENKEERILMR